MDNVEHPTDLNHPHADLSFSDALIYLKRGYRLYRKGWNGKNLYVYFMSESTHIEFDMEYDNFDLVTQIEPHFVLISTTCTNVWVPSVSDILADDWATIGG
jgi:hypothetical protein